MDRDGEESKMRIDSEANYVARDKLAGLPPESFQTTNAVTASLLPFKKILPRDQLFRTVKTNMEWLQGSLLLDAIFTYYWMEERGKIMRRAFLPFLTFFIVAHIYYIIFLDPQE